ncbi:metallopeptidase [Grosmannia clavigera kw1407]|uniref:Xaa-Pro aminopeptidase n=1 Tax=Grosmannia clavigera (strain kw1407 / UAMH 11150) TaxID=655863 RepID=F0XMJ1_GROCL|nr:metallopeptidase [Grosmannia clavigera kw1407]EFX01520.1 metallopeptidase [Grosmannia clavigera kw1407]
MEHALPIRRPTAICLQQLGRFVALPLCAAAQQQQQQCRPCSAQFHQSRLISSAPCHPRRKGSCARPSHRSYASVSAADLLFGQPVHETHPHLLEAGELTPGISAQEYYERRCALAAGLPADSAAVLPAADIKFRSGAVFFPFRQESDFFYLTGFSEPEALAVVRKTGPGREDCEFSLLVRPKDARAEQWAGPWSGIDAARDVFNADETASIHAAETVLPRLLQGVSTVYTDAPPQSRVATILQAVSGLGRTLPLAPVVAQQRAFKSSAEIANMRRAGQLSGRALTDAMRQPWTREKDLANFLAHGFTRDGGDGIAYVPVVAGGPRGRLIHYVLNNAALTSGETVLVDAGGEYGTYITDITRTWPVSGRFSPPQRDLYEAVLRVQRSSVSLCRAAGRLSLDQIHRITSEGLRSELTKLGFDLGSGDSALNVLFPHHVGHYVGLDVHDTPSYPRHIPLRAGHCVTIEPGIYVPDDTHWPAHFRGLAVRIEDSICVDEEDPHILTTEAVKEVVDIEALREVAEI